MLCRRGLPCRRVFLAMPGRVLSVLLSLWFNWQPPHVAQLSIAVLSVRYQSKNACAALCYLCTCTFHLVQGWHGRGCCCAVLPVSHKGQPRKGQGGKRARAKKRGKPR
jgi:hypothetical protein